MTRPDSVLAAPAATLRALGMTEVVLGLLVALVALGVGAPTVWAVLGGLLFLAGHVLVAASYLVRD